VFPDISKFGLTSKEFATHLLMEEQVAAVPGNAFGPSGEGFLRCCYATAFDQIKEACIRMERFVGKLNHP
ncbi:MAG: pyridoxal phosphate-dependent aminotransferase, partial [Akkermansia sp.]